MKYTFFLFKIVIKYCWVFNYLGWYFFLHFISSTEVLFYFSYHSLYISFSIFLICRFRRAENFFFGSFLFLIYSFCILAPIVFNLVFNDLTKIFSSPCISFRCVLRNYFEISILFLPASIFFSFILRYQACLTYSIFPPLVNYNPYLL